MNDTAADLVVVEAAELPNPITGELVPVGDLPALTDAITLIREKRDQLNNALAAFSDAIVQESIRQGTRTLNIGKRRIEVSADYEVEWDIPLLQEGLLAAGLPQDRLDQLVIAKVDFKVDGRVARQLAGANPDYKEAIEAAKGRAPKRQYVTVKPA